MGYTRAGSSPAADVFTLFFHGAGSGDLLPPELLELQCGGSGGLFVVVSSLSAFL